MSILVAEARPEEEGEGGKEDERRVKEDMSGLGYEAVLEGDEQGSQKSGCCAAIKSTKCEIGNRYGGDTKEGGHHTHGYVRYVVIHPRGSQIHSLLSKGYKRRTFQYP